MNRFKFFTGIGMIKPGRVIGLILFFVSAVGVLLSGCAALKSVGISPQESGRAQYLAVLRNWTRKSDVYKDLSAVMYVRATYYSPPFIKEYAKEYARNYMLNEKAYRQKLDTLSEDYKKSTSFMVSFYVPDNAYNNLDSPHSIWMVYLVNDRGQAVMPESIKPVKQKLAYIRSFFPYAAKWSKQYIVKFPLYYDKESKTPFLGPGAKSLKLVITGVNGKASLEWNLPE